MSFNYCATQKVSKKRIKGIKTDEASLLTLAGLTLNMFLKIFPRKLMRITFLSCYCRNFQDRVLLDAASLDQAATCSKV